MCNPSQPYPARDIELGESSSLHERMKQLLEDDEASISTSSPSKRNRTNSQNHHNDSPCPTKPNSDTGLMSFILDGLPPTQQMLTLSFLMFLFFGMHNILQEAIVNLLSNSEELTPESSKLKANGTVMLAYAETVGVLGFSFMERVYMTNEGGWSRKASLRAYPLLTLCLFASSSLSNLSLSYINFPTKVVFRSCKLVPTMIIATLVNQRVFQSYEYLAALSICAGLVLFAMGDYQMDPLQFEPTGLLLVGGSVVADAILPNAQEHLFKDGSSRLEVTVYSNLFSFLGLTVLTLGNGTLIPFFRGIRTNSTLALYFGVYVVLSYISISCYMTLVKRFGGVTAVVLTTARKAMTILLSFLLFPKGFSWLYVHGSVLVLGAVMVVGICKKLSANKNKPSSKRQEEFKPLLSNKETEDDASSCCTARTERTASSGSERSDTSVEKILQGISKREYV